jgi:lipid-A-disaccharide synthase
MPATCDNSVNVMMVAGEASGDKHGAALARSLVRLYPEKDIWVFGSGGDEMRAAGVRTLVDARSVAIIGIPEIAAALGRLYRAYRILIKAARDNRPDVVILIDWPDFNLRLAKRLHREGFKVVYYISPQVWAWRRYRVRAIRRSVDRMLVILPFEQEFYRAHGVDVEYVGHPLVGAVNITASREEFVLRHGLDPARPIIALLPGSRKKEVHYHMPLLVAAANIVTEQGRPKSPRLTPSNTPHVASSDTPQFVVPLASTIDASEVTALIASPPAEIKVIAGDTYNALGHSEAAVVASGTATVEAALIGTPMVIIYRASELNWRLIRPLIRLDTFGMVNLIAGRRIVPELMQRDATGENIARELSAILRDAGLKERMREDLRLVGSRLGDEATVPASDRAARAVMRIASRQ